MSLLIFHKAAAGQKTSRHAALFSEILTGISCAGTIFRSVASRRRASFSVQ